MKYISSRTRMQHWTQVQDVLTYQTEWERKKPSCHPESSADLLILRDKIVLVPPLYQQEDHETSVIYITMLVVY